MEETQTELAGYQRFLLHAWVRVELINKVVTPQWTYRMLLIPHDFIYKQLDKLSQEFVTKYKGLENVLHSTKMTTPVTKGGMGLCQQFWVFRMLYVTDIQRLLRDLNASSNPWG